MWKEAGISGIGIVNFVVSCRLELIHYTSRLSNPTHALIEGWAEFMEGIFENGSTPYSVRDVYDSNDKLVGPLGPPPINRGESVEGAFANGLWEIFYHSYVVQSAGRPPISESRNGDVSVTAPWIKDPDVKRRFKGMIWDPLKDLKGKKDPTTADFLAKMKSMHPSEWHRFAYTLNQYNMAITPVSITSVSPTTGPRSGGQTVTISGAEFVELKTKVKIGGTEALVRVVDNNTLTCITPRRQLGEKLDNLDVVVANDAGESRAKDTYTYI